LVVDTPKSTIPELSFIMSATLATNNIF
jgi:hypothetical protein